MSHTSIEWKNFDQLAAASRLQTLKNHVSLPEVMAGENGAARVAKYCTPMAAGLAFNYASREIDDEVLEALGHRRRRGQAHLLCGAAEEGRRFCPQGTQR